MTENEAIQLMGVLVANTNGWDELSIESWKRQLMALANTEAAQRAVELLVRTWTTTARPPWGKLMEAYSPKPDPDRWTALPSGRQAMSALTYLRKVRERADAGDRQAGNELADWERMIKTSNVWGRALPGMTEAARDQGWTK